MSALPPEDDRTIMPPSGATGPGASSAQDNDSNVLQSGVRLGEFEVLSVIGSGGFGIVYLAYDHSLQRKVALKEYMPSSLAARSSLLHVTVKSERHAETFQAGMRSFINEARLLAQFDHPSLLKVYRFWEANGTAYMAMPFYQGLTLTQTLRGRETPPDEVWLRSLLAPLLDALETLHAEQCFHRDIAPDNILMLADDRPLLLDFGAARRAIGGMAQAFTVILKPGYAPIEQYADVATMQQGAWTDLYALASVVHFAITGRPPVPSVARIVSDPQIPLAKSAAGRYSDAFLQVIDRALCVKPQDRPQSVAEFRSLLGLQSAKAKEPPPIVRLQPKAPLAIQEFSSTDRKRPTNIHMRVIAMGAVLILAGAAVSFWLVTRDAAVPPASKVLPNSQLPPTEQTVQTTAQPAPAENALPVAKPVDPLKMLEEIIQARNTEHTVSISLDKRQVRIGKDALRFSIRSSKPGYVYLLMVGTDQSQFWLLFPNAIDKNNRISADRQLDLPRSNWRMDAAGPPGTDHFVAIVSESPRDFGHAGLKPNGPFSEFPLTAIMLPEKESLGMAPVFAGKVSCSENQTSICSELYGAEIFTIEEILTR
ncbi:serine/threonine-protein kinase [Polaromonas glacialis]|uniref:serine/threonine-protein kinase n=1 Tax=Polaromonas glacialis TaxID=866564 RepID=UPI00068FDF0F|nr:serine/threonine-protein kinase [Polaromonas glacialis]